MNRSCFWGSVAFALVATSNVAFAADAVENCGASNTITARAWFTSIEAEKADYSVPLYGGSYTFSPDVCSGYSFSVTAFMGSGESTDDVDYFAEDGGVVYGPFSADEDVDRFDLELVMQGPIAEGFRWTLGGRYIKASNSTSNIDFGSFDASLDDKYSFYLGEAGLAWQQPFDGGLFVFANALAVGGIIDAEFGYDYDPGGNVSYGDLNEFGFGFDANAGLGFALESVSVSARYRVFQLWQDDIFGDDGLLVHGPEVNVGLTF